MEVSSGIEPSKSGPGACADLSSAGLVVWLLWVIGFSESTKHSFLPTESGLRRVTWLQINLAASGISEQVIHSACVAGWSGAHTGVSIWLGSMWSVLTTGSQNFWPEGAVSVPHKWHMFTYYLWLLTWEEDERSFTCQSKQRIPIHCGTFWENWL